MNIAMVNYYNTLPFLEGLSSVEDYNIILDIPSRCLEYYIRGECDIALVPVGALSDISDREYKIITDYCIGCDDEVGTVSLLTNTQVPDLKTIYLDGHSRTSAKLVQILCKEYWRITPDFLHYDGQALNDGEGVLLIGDKVFSQKENFTFNHDLGTVWKHITDLPFAFAVWISRPQMDEETISVFNQYLKEGVATIDTIDWNSRVEGIDLQKYYKEYIDYAFDDKKKKAVKKFTAFANLFV